MATATEEIKFEYKQSSEGLVIPLFYLDTSVYPNPGGVTRGTSEAMMELRKSLKAEGQLDAVRAALDPSGEKVNVYAGFRRTEASRQNALEKIVRAYNKAKDLKSGDDGYIVLNDPTSRAKVADDTSEIPDTDGDTWANAYERALKETTILVSLGEVKDPLDARMKNLASNEARENFTVMELCGEIIMLVNEGVKQKQIGKSLGRSESKISQSLKIGRFPGALRDIIKENKGDSGDKDKEEAEVLLGCVDELERRMALPKNDRCSISFSHLREFSGRVIVSASKEPLQPRTIFSLLKTLVRCGENGKVDETKDTMDYGVFLTLIKDEEKKEKLATKEEEEEEGKEEQAAGETVEGVAEAQEAQTATAEAEAKEANAQEEDQAPKPTATEEKVAEGISKPAEEEAGDEGAVEAVDTAGESAETAAELAGPTDEDAAQAEVGTEEAAEDAGKSRTKTTDAPTEEAFKVKDAITIKNTADQYMQFAGDESSTLVDKAAFLSVAAELFDVIGCSEEHKKVSAAGTEFVEGLDNYINALQDTLRNSANSGKAPSKETLKGLVAKRPVITGLDIGGEEDGEAADDK